VTRFCALLPARVAAALAVAAALLGTTIPAHATPASGDPTPLVVRIDSVSPAAVPAHGPITITGTVTNDSQEIWRSVRVYPLTSTTPMTTHPELAAAVESPPDSVIGDRILTDGAPIGDLDPRDSRRFTVTLRHRDIVDKLSAGPGVYWLGVHALGDGSVSGSRNVAAGRARTFLPRLPSRASRNPASVALVLPLRQQIDRVPDGSLADPAAWPELVSPTGDLGRLLSFANAGWGMPITWLVDPGVVRAVEDMAVGNPKLDVARASADNDPSPSSSATTSDPDSTDKSAPNPFQNWLRSWTTTAQEQPVLTLPYADPDVSAIGTAHLDVLQRAWKLGSSVLDPLQLRYTRAIAPVDGSLNPRTLAPQATGTTILTSTPTATTGVTTTGGLRYVTTDTLLDPSSTDLIDVRQRILADAAVRALARDSDPVVALMPPVWTSDPSTNASFFAPFQNLPWVRLTKLPNGRPVPSVEVPWTARDRAARVGRRNIAATTHLLSAATTATDLFADPGIGDRLAGIALNAVSQYARAHPARARERTTGADAAIRSLFDQVQVEGTRFVTLSGDNGSLTVAMFNGLDRSVHVALSARTDDPRLKLSAPPTFELTAGRRTTVRLQARTRTVGVHQVRLQPVTSEGTPVGKAFEFSIRTSQVGQFFWYVVIAGTVVVALLIVWRIRQRLVARDTRAPGIRR